MSTASLTATQRSAVGKGAARSLRRDGHVPGVIYGHARQAQALTVNERELDKLLSHIAAGSTVVELTVDGTMSRTLIREIQRHPIKRQVLHVDFQELVAGEKVTVRIPIVLSGTPAGVREGGILDQVLRDLEIEVDPVNIPVKFEVDVSGLTIGHSVHVRDLPLPEGVTVRTDAAATICVVSVPRAVVEETAAVAAEPGEVAEPEVIRSKAKTDEEEEGGEKGKEKEKEKDSKKK